MKHLNDQLAKEQDISLYVHLPFCEELCTYCGCNKRITKRHDVEDPYIDAVVAEWRIYLRSLHQRPRIKELHLGGGTPTFFSPENLARLVKGLLEHVEVAEGHSFGFEAHPNSTTKEHLTTLADLGFNRVSIGVQDFNPEIMELINRRQTPEEVQQTVANARAAGYKSINFDVIYGLPKQTRNDIIRTAVKIQELKPDRIAFYGYAHVPWVSKGQRAYDVDDLPQGREKWALYEIGRELLECSGYQDIGLDHFALETDDLMLAAKENRLHRNFMGYTTANTPVTIALGCSSISDSWDTFVQNEKKVETYAKIVKEEHRLPIVKGHRLKPQDLTVRRHILNLMCKGLTDWRLPSQRCSALERAVEQWDEMAADGLLTRTPYGVSITDAGKPFLRNICLPLDDYYWRKRPSIQTFSKAI